MFLEIIHSEHLAHLSYILGDGTQAAVIDPRRDVRIYLDKAREHGVNITHIFETHRNEDYVTGSMELARMTGAEIFHGRGLDFTYGQSVKEGDSFSFGDILLEVLETPGHTFESISLVLSDQAYGPTPVAVFTGDALFIGDVGRTDFFPDRKEEVAGMLYDSIFHKILPLGDQVILYPAHGAGSVCGSTMSAREFSTLGYERKHNPALQVAGREAFVRKKTAELHYKPPYFKKMEEYNLHGTAPLLGCEPAPSPFHADAFEQSMQHGMQVVDCRSPEAFAGAFVPGSLALPLNLIPAYGGYFLDYSKPIGLIVDQVGDAEKAYRHLWRLGYDSILGYLANGLHGWESSGRQYDRIKSVHTGELVQRIQDEEEFTLLDVRKEGEYQNGHLPNATHIFLGHLPEQLNHISKDKPIVTFCGSGVRAIVAASILKRSGFDHVEDALGSMAACSNLGCPIES